MADKDLKKSIVHYKNKFDFLGNLFGKKGLEVSFDVLNNNKSTDYELLYFNLKGDDERKGIFVFSYPFYIKELKDLEFKRLIGNNYLNFKIHNAYLKLCKKSKDGFVSINKIIDLVVDSDICKADSLSFKNKILKRILTLAYYHNWDLKKDNKSLDTDYFVVIPDNFKKVKKRFDLSVLVMIGEDEDCIFYVNNKGDLIFVLKNCDKFAKKDVEAEVFSALKKHFKIGDIKVK